MTNTIKQAAERMCKNGCANFDGNCPKGREIDPKTGQQRCPLAREEHLFMGEPPMSKLLKIEM